MKSLQLATLNEVQVIADSMCPPATGTTMISAPIDWSKYGQIAPAITQRIDGLPADHDFIQATQWDPDACDHTFDDLFFEFIGQDPDETKPTELYNVHLIDPTEPAGRVYLLQFAQPACISDPADRVACFNHICLKVRHDIKYRVAVGRMRKRMTTQQPRDVITLKLPGATQ